MPAGTGVGAAGHTVHPPGGWAGEPPGPAAGREPSGDGPTAAGVGEVRAGSFVVMGCRRAGRRQGPGRTANPGRLLGLRPSAGILDGTCSGGFSGAVILRRKTRFFLSFFWHSGYKVA